MVNFVYWLATLKIDASPETRQAFWGIVWAVLLFGGGLTSLILIVKGFTFKGIFVFWIAGMFGWPCVNKWRFWSNVWDTYGACWKDDNGKPKWESENDL